jgi:hypothetical protein
VFDCACSVTVRVIYINRGVQAMHSLKGSELMVLTTGFKYMEERNKLYGMADYD